MEEHEPVEQISQDGELDEELDVYDPPGVTRTSTYGIAALVAAFIALSRFPFSFASILFRGPPGNSRDWFGLVVDMAAGFLVPIVASVIAIVLAGRSEMEIELGDGSIGGRGLAVGATWMSRSVLVLCAVLFALVIIFATMEPLDRPFRP